MFRRFVSTAVLLSILAPQVCFAQESNPISPDPEKANLGTIPQVKLAPGEIDPGKALSPMKKGQKAPFTGVLMSPAAVAETIVDIETIEERIHIEVVNATKVAEAECEKKVSIAENRLGTENKILKASVDGKVREINILNVELKKAHSFTRNPYFWGSVGFVTGVVLSGLTVYAISQTTK